YQDRCAGRNHLRQSSVRLLPGFNKTMVILFGFVGFTERKLGLHQSKVGASAARIALERGVEKFFGFSPSFKGKTEFARDLFHWIRINWRFGITQFVLLFDSFAKFDDGVVDLALAS